MRNFMQNGERMHIKATGAVKGGELVVVGDMVAVASTDAVKDVVYSAGVSGVFSLPKADAEALSQGARCYLGDGKKITATAGDVVVGIVWEEAAAGDAFVAVKINV